MPLFEEERQRTFGMRRPQENQYLQGDSSTDPLANTRWMGPNGNTGFTGGSSIPRQPTTPTNSNNGTALGAITAGNVGQYMPEGYDQRKWDSGHSSPKYDVFRILSKYPPGPEGLQAAGPELQQAGYKLSGKDGIIGPDGVFIDVGRGFSGGQNMGWWWNPHEQGGSNSGGILGQSGMMNPGGIFSPENLQRIIQILMGQGYQTKQNPVSTYFQQQPQNQGPNQVNTQDVRNSPLGFRLNNAQSY